ncbi:dioxygenase [Geobacter sp. FeAm09]|uniref:DODA-type extradiol aromatic ring-opening family dioxygenase n=1 Tax=Geobacter sp. FeAm09 TaxID=2597769 RepID=UPI0011ED7A74|nr:class III extradiol ring-cleavage dioxygenase [Geobacter sp. FeAm09]QEM68526.1 dioxygenase [Geobacter sp. FeAm09]
MKPALPTLFISHGAPTLLIDPVPTRDFLATLGADMPRPQGIVCISAHWTTRAPLTTHTAQPDLIYDFGGFPDELYRMTYPAPGNPSLAERVTQLLENRGIETGRDMARGLDHGAWVPLKLMYPHADIPVVQLSVQPHLGPAHHAAIGAALRPLREEGVLILASGSATHNLRDFFGRALDAPPPQYVKEFDDWLCRAVEADDRDSLLEYRDRGPNALANHPTPEHFLPLFVAMGAGGQGRVLHRAFTYGVISMGAFAWE